MAKAFQDPQGYWLAGLEIASRGRGFVSLRAAIHLGQKPIDQAQTLDSQSRKIRLDRRYDLRRQSQNTQTFFVHNGLYDFAGGAFDREREERQGRGHGKPFVLRLFSAIEFRMDERGCRLVFIKIPLFIIGSFDTTQL
jgi:hypothetical protein